MPRGLESTRTFAVYYGRGSEHVLADFDLVVLEPANADGQALRLLRAKGTRVLARLPLLSRPAGGRPPEGVLTLAGEAMTDALGQVWFLDPRHPAVAAGLVAEAKRLGAGFDGLFLDGLMVLEDPRLPRSLRARLIPAAARIVARLVEEVGIGLTVQGGALDALLPLSAPYLDGVLWEDFPFRRIGPLPALHPGIRRLHALQEQLGLNVLCLNQGPGVGRERGLAALAAARCDFLWYGTEDPVLLPVEVDR